MLFAIEKRGVDRRVRIGSWWEQPNLAPEILNLLRGRIHAFLSAGRPGDDALLPRSGTRERASRCVVAVPDVREARKRARSRDARPYARCCTLWPLLQGASLVAWSCCRRSSEQRLRARME